MAIHTSAIVYTRGIPKTYNNFFFVERQTILYLHQ